MKRINKLRNEFNKSNEDNNTIDDAVSSNSIDNRSDINVSLECESKTDSNQLQHQIAEEKAAARIFPLNLISNRFKSKDPNALKGISYKLNSISVYNSSICCSL